MSATTTAAAAASRLVSVPNDNHGSKHQSNNDSIQKHSNANSNKMTTNQQQKPKTLQFCWYWHENQYWWPALYFSSTMEAQMHCAPYMKNPLLKRHFTSLALQEALQRLKYKHNKSNSSNRPEEEDDRYPTTTPTVALFDRNDDYWLIQLDANSLVERGNSNGNSNDNNNSNNDVFWESLIVRMHETAEVIEGNAALELRLQGAMQHLYQHVQIPGAASSCTSSSNSTRLQQQAGHDDEKEKTATMLLSDENDKINNKDSDHANVAATTVAAPAPHHPADPVAAAAAATALTLQDQASAGAKAAAASAAASNSNENDTNGDDNDNDMMVDTNHNDNDDDENQAMSHDKDNLNNTSSHDESRKNDNKDESSAASSRRAPGGEEWIPPVEGDDPIQPNDVWETVEAKLEFSGWTKRRPAATMNSGTNNNNQTNGLVSAFWWVKPGRPSENGGVLGQDYFDSVPLLQAFCQRAYGWQGSQAGAAAAALPPPPPASPRPEPQHRRQSARGKGGMITPENRKTRPQHPGKPLFIDDDDDDDDDEDASGAADSPIPKVDLNDATATGHSSSTTSSFRSRMSPADAASFARFWAKLRRLDWRAYRGSELEDWIYCKPGIKPSRDLEAQENVDYFKTPHALLEYFQNKHSKKLFDANQEHAEEEEDDDEQEMEEEEKESNQSQKRKQKETTKKPKPKEPTKKPKPKEPTKKRKPVPTAQKQTAKKQKNTTSKTTTEKVAMVDPHWWKTVPVPSSNDVWPFLEHLQFSRDANGYYHLPGEDLFNALTFRSLQGLRTFLCLYGIPGGNDSSLYSEDVETLERWIKFANVPVTKRNSVARLQNIPSPRNDAVLMQMLCDLGCSTVNGNLHLPISDLFRSRRKMNFTHFDLQDPESRKQARIAVRGQLWTFPKLNSVKEERLLQVALWSAKSSSHDLPEFVDLPETQSDPNDPVQMRNKELLKKLSVLPALVSYPDDEEPVEQGEDKGAMEEEEEEEEQSSLASLGESSQEPQSDEDDSEEEQSDNDEVSVDAVDDEMSATSIDDDDDSQGSSVIEVVDLQRKATSTKGKKSSKQAKTPKRPTAMISQTTAKVKKQQQPVTESKQQKSNEPWWKTQPIPSGRSIWPFLNRLGFSMDDRGNYHLPAKLYDANSFVNLQALRIFLCHYGIPNIDSTSLSKKEKTQLINWVKFANVPVGAKNSVQKLADVQHPTDTTIVHLLCQHGWKTVDGHLYVPNHSYDPKLREKGVDVFEYHQLESHVRLLVRRRLWRYSYVERHERQHLQLALWAATAEADLPQFTIPPEESELRKFDEVSDIEDSGESESESAAMPLQQPMAHRKKSKAKSAVESDSVPAYAPKPQKEIKAKKDLRSYFIREPIPVLAQVWSTLEILGFKRNGSTFSHPQLTGKTFADERSLRAFLVKERVDGLAVTRDDFSQEDQEMFDHWVKWTFVPGLTPQNSVQKIQDYKNPTDATIDNWLQKVRIQRLDGGFHFPTSDKDHSQQRREGIHYVVSLDALRVHIRERSNDDLKKIDLLDLAALKSQELFLFRSWAATSDALLPIFTKPKPLRRDRGSSLLVETQSAFAASTCQGDEVDNASPSEETQQESAQKSEMMITDARVAAQPDEVGNQPQSPKQRPLLDDTAMPMQDELDEDDDDESNMQEEDDTRFSASSPVIPLTQPGGGEDDDDVEQDDDDEMSLFDDSSSHVASVFPESKASGRLPGSALSPKSPSIGSATSNISNDIGCAAAPATEASQLAENAVLTYTTFKNSKGSSSQASATETAQQENTTDASHDDLDDMDEWNHPFTQ